MMQRFRYLAELRSSSSPAGQSDWPEENDAILVERFSDAQPQGSRDDSVRTHHETHPSQARGDSDLAACPAFPRQAGRGQATPPSRPAQSGGPMRIRHGLYMRPIEVRLRMRGPRLAKALDALSTHRDEASVLNGRDVVDRLGLPTQKSGHVAHMASGPDRVLDFGGRWVRQLDGSCWQLAPHHRAGEEPTTVPPQRLAGVRRLDARELQPTRPML